MENITNGAYFVRVAGKNAAGYGANSNVASISVIGTILYLNITILVLLIFEVCVIC